MGIFTPRKPICQCLELMKQYDMWTCQVHGTVERFIDHGVRPQQFVAVPSTAVIYGVKK